MFGGFLLHKEKSKEENEIHLAGLMVLI